MALEKLKVRIDADTTGFDRGLRRVRSGITGLKKESANVTSGLTSITNGFKSMIKTGLAIAGITMGLKTLADSFKVFTDFESSVLRVNDLFDDAAKYVEYFAENTAEKFGMGASAAYQYASVYGNLFRGITASSEENAKVTIAMLKASAVVASKTGRTMEDVMERIRSGLLGNTEAIEDLGIHVNIAMLESTEAFRRIADGRSWQQLTFHEQQQIRTLAILEQAHKNFGDTVQQSSAYSLSVLSGAFKDLMATAGAFINHALAPIVSWLIQVVRWATAGLKTLAALFGVKLKGDLGSVSSDVSSNLATGAQSADDLKKGLGGATKAAKELKRTVAGFDELNILNEPKASGSSGGSGGSGSGGGAGGAGGGGSVFAGLPDLEYGEMQGPDLAWIENAKKALEPAITSFQNLWTAMEPFRNFVAQGAIDFYNNFLVPVGQWVLGEGIPRLVDALAFGFSSINWEAISTGLNELWAALTPFAINVGEGLLWFWENVLVPIGVWGGNTLVPLFLDACTAATNALNDILESGNPTIRWFYDNVLVPFGSWIGNDVIPLFFEGFKSALDIFVSVIKTAQPLVVWLWDRLLNPIAKWTGGIIIDVLKDITDELKSFSDWIANNQTLVETLIILVGSFAAAWGLVNAAIAVWNAIGVVATGVTSAFGAAVAFLTSPIGLVVVAIGGLIAIVVLLARHWDDVKATAGRVWDWIKDIWGKAADWINTHVVQPIGKIFSRLWEGIKSGFVGFINLVIRGINKMINGFLKPINFLIKGWNATVGKVAGTIPEIKIAIPEIPQFAAGGVVDSPTVAMIGEGGYKEAVVPLERNTSWIDTLAEKLAARMPVQAAAEGNITIPVYFGNDLFDTIIVKANERRVNKTGGR